MEVVNLRNYKERSLNKLTLNKTNSFESKMLSSPRALSFFRAYFIPSNTFAAIKRKKYSSRDPIYPVIQGLKFAHCHALAAFNETIDIVFMFFLLIYFEVYLSLD